MSVARRSRGISGRSLASLARWPWWVGVGAAGLLGLAAWLGPWGGSRAGWSTGCFLAGPAALGEAERQGLRAAGIEAVYLPVGRLAADPAALEDAPDWPAAAGEFRTHLVIDLPPDPPEPGLAAAALTGEWERAAAAGWKPAGFLLRPAGGAEAGALAGWLARLRPVLPEGAALSLLAPPAWSKAPEAAELAGTVDEVVVRSEWRPGGDLRAAADEAAALAFGTRLVLLIPTGGAAQLVFPGGRREPAAPAALPGLPADPAWELRLAGTRLDSRGVPTEDELRFRSREATWLLAREVPSGATVEFRRPRAEALAAFLRLLERRGPRELAGILFETPPDGSEPLALGAREVAAARRSLSELPPEVSGEASEHGLRLRLANPGAVGGAVLPRAVQLTARVPPGSVLGVTPGGFRFEGSFLDGRPVPVRQAEELRFSRPFLFGGEEVVIAELRTPGGEAPEVEIAWEAARSSDRPPWRGDWRWAGEVD